MPPPPPPIYTGGNLVCQRFISMIGHEDKVTTYTGNCRRKKAAKNDAYARLPARRPNLITASTSVPIPACFESRHHVVECTFGNGAYFDKRSENDVSEVQVLI